MSRRKPTGWIPPTAYSFSGSYVSLAYGTCVSNYKYNDGHPCDYGGHYSGVVGGQGGRFNSLNHFDQCVLESVLWDPTDSMLNTALIRARTKLKSSDINLGVAFGERKQTARLVGDTAIRFVKALRALKAGRIRHAMNVLGISHRRRQPRGSNWTRNWLELQYGWKPFTSDIYGAVRALSKRDRSDWRVTVKATVKESLLLEREFGSWDASTCRAEGVRLAKVRIDAMPSNEAAISLSALGVLNPLEVAWELVPFSFVADWFIPIGTWLSSLDALLGYGEGTYASYTRFMKVKWTDKGHNATVGDFTVTNDFLGTKEVVKLLRTTSSGVDLPTFPSIKDPRSLGHMANALALLTQVVGRHRS